MRKSKFTEEQIVGILREREAGTTATEVCRRHGISQPTFYKWRAKYRDSDALDAGRPEEQGSSKDLEGGSRLKGFVDESRLKGLEDENQKLKKLLVEAMLKNDALKDLLGKD